MWLGYRFCSWSSTSSLAHPRKVVLMWGSTASLKQSSSTTSRSRLECRARGERLVRRETEGDQDRATNGNTSTWEKVVTAFGDFAETNSSKLPLPNPNRRSERYNGQLRLSCRRRKFRRMKRISQRSMLRRHPSNQRLHHQTKTI